MPTLRPADPPAADPPVVDTPAVGALKTLLVTDLVDSTRLVGRLGDFKAMEIATRHDRVARDLVVEMGGQEIDKSDGFLILFDQPTAAVAWALAYHQALFELSRQTGVQLRARAGIHEGEVFLRHNTPEDVAHGAKPLEVEGIAKPTAARVMSVARGKQTLLTQQAFDRARRSAENGLLARRDVAWLAHGPYLLKGVEEPIELFEVGVEGRAPLKEPPDSAKVRRAVAAGDEITLGWRPAPGQEIPGRDGWVLGQKLGEGGFGEVWLAHDAASGERRVFKFCFEAERLRALQREVTLFRLIKEALGNRRDIVPILDWNFDRAPYFIEAEYTEGGSLEHWAEQQGGIEQVSLATRLELAAQIAEALAAAHSVGVLHKDVKPANVLITTGADGEPQARLTDFGIGLVTSEKLLIDRGITVVGLTELLPDGETAGAGTPLYAAPEVLEGKVPTVQADLYALGVLIYQLVVGDLSRALARGWRRDVGDDLLAEDIARFVDGHPERRPGNGLEIAERLRTLDQRRARREAERRAAAEAAAAQRALERAQRRRRLAAAYGAVATAVAVVVALLALQAVDARREADRRWQHAEELVGFMLGDLNEKLEPMSRLDVLHDVADKAMDYFAAAGGEDLSDEEVARRTRALIQIGTVRRTEGDPEAALDAFRQALDMARELTRRSPESRVGLLEQALANYWLGKVHWSRGDLGGAEDSFRAQRTILDAAATHWPEDPEIEQNLAYARNNLGFVQRERGDLEGARESLAGALEVLWRLAERRPQADRKPLFNQTLAVGDILWRLGELAAAVEHLRSAREIAEVEVDGDPGDLLWGQNLSTAHYYLGRVSAAAGERRAASEHFRRNLEIAGRLAAVDAGHTRYQRQLAVAHRWMALDLAQRGEPQQAVEHARRSLAICERLVAKDPTNARWRRDLAAGRVALGEVRQWEGDFGGALDSAGAAVAALEARLAENGEDRTARHLLARGELQVGRALAGLGRPGEARAAWRRAAETLEPLVRGSPDTALTETRVRLLLHLGRDREAEPLCERLRSLGWDVDRYRDEIARLPGRSS